MEILDAFFRYGNAIFYFFLKFVEGFQLQSITIHCNRRKIDRYISHVIFLRHFCFCVHTTLWFKVSVARIHSICP